MSISAAQSPLRSWAPVTKRGLCHALRRPWKYPMMYFAGNGSTRAPRRQVWLDFRGHGQSGMPKAQGPLKVERIIRDIVELCAFRDIRTATFLGQSMGGSIALEVAHQYPKLASGLVLLTTPYF